MRDLHEEFHLMRFWVDVAEDSYKVGDYEGVAERLSEAKRVLHKIWVELRKDTQSGVSKEE